MNKIETDLQKGHFQCHSISDWLAKRSGVSCFGQRTKIIVLRLRRKLIASGNACESWKELVLSS